MTKYLVLACIVAAIGCGDVTAELGPDGGAAGAVGAGGAGGAAAGGAAGIDAGGAAGQAGGQAGTGGAGGQREVDAGCVPTSCTTCVNGTAIPIADGTQCGGGLCDGVSPFYGENSCTMTNFACKAGACVATSVNCCALLGCKTGQAACTGSAADPTQPTMCTTVCVF